MPRSNWLRKIRDLWNGDQVHGIELIFDICLVGLRFVSMSYLLKDCLLPWVLDKLQISDDRKRRVYKDNLVDCYSFLQFLVLLVLLFLCHYPSYAWFLAAYIVFETYLNIFSIFFLPRQKSIGPPEPSDIGKVNEPSTTAERSLLLAFLNVLQIILAFGTFFRQSNPDLAPHEAVWAAVSVFGTLGARDCLPISLVSLQILLDFPLVILALGALVGRLGGFAKQNGI